MEHKPHVIHNLILESSMGMYMMLIPKSFPACWGKVVSWGQVWCLHRIIHVIQKVFFPPNCEYLCVFGVYCKPVSNDRDLSWGYIKQILNAFHSSQNITLGKIRLLYFTPLSIVKRKSPDYLATIFCYNALIMHPIFVYRVIIFWYDFIY